VRCLHSGQWRAAALALSLDGGSALRLSPEALGAARRLPPQLALGDFREQVAGRELLGDLFVQRIPAHGSTMFSNVRSSSV
jgi:hypothetical protein